MTKWLDRALFISPYHYRLCLTEKAYRKELRRLKIPRHDRPAFLLDGVAHACAHYFIKGDGGLVCIVTLGSTKGQKRLQVHALLVHEAVHLWQAIRERMSEKEPSSEFEAYAVQTIAQRLMESYEKQR